MKKHTFNKSRNKLINGALRTAALAWTMAGAVSCSSPVGALKDYTLFNMPSNNYRIGSVIDVKKQSTILQQKFEDEDPIVSRSPGPARVVEKIRTAYEASIDAKVKAALSANGSVSGSDSVSVHLQNVMLWSIPQQSLVSKLTETVGGWSNNDKEYFSKATRRRFFGILPPRLETVTISDLLIADFNVEKTSTDAASGGGKFTPSEMKILRDQFAGEGSGKTTSKKDGSFEGKNMCFGFKGDPRIFSEIMKTFGKTSRR